MELQGFSVVPERIGGARHRKGSAAQVRGPVEEIVN